MGKGEQKTDKPENLLPVPGDVEKGAKSKSASDIFYRAPSSPKVTAAVTLSVCILLIVILALVVALAVVVSRVPEPLLVKLTCPDGWVGYRGKCYYFSEAEENWDSSRSRCSALGASLAGIDTQQDLTFLMRYKGPHYHWIGLRREEEAQPWKWENGTEFNNLFEVKGGAHCVYLNDVGVLSSRCLTTKKWICSKPSGHPRKD